MAIKKDQFKKYVELQEKETLIRQEQAKRSKYSHGTVFDNSNLSEKRSSKVSSKNIFSESNHAIEKTMFKLTGAQEKLFIGLLRKADIDNKLLICKIKIEELALLSNTSFSNTKIAIKRLIDKELIRREKGKPSIYGYYNLKINDMAYEIAKNSKIF